MGKINTKNSWIPASIKMSIAASIFILMPSYLDIISRQFSTPIEHLTFLASTELLGYAIAPLLCFWASKLKIIIKENLAIFLLGACQFSSVFCESIELFFVLRAISGICAGIILVRAFEALAHCANPDAAFAKAIGMQMVYSAVMFLILPSLSLWFGIAAFFILLTILSWSLLLLKTQQAISEAYPVVPCIINYRLLITGILAIFMFMVTHSAAWSMLGILATSHHISAQAQGNVLAMGTIFSLLGAVLSAIAAQKFDTRRGLIIFSLLLQALILAVLFNAQDAYEYMLAVAFFMLLWNFIFPLFMGAIAQADTSGGAMRFVVAAQTIGAALGPSVVLRGWVALELIIFLIVTLLLIYPLISNLQKFQKVTQ